MNGKITGAACALDGIALAVGVKTVFSPCIHTDGSTSMCAGSGQWIFILALIITLLALVRVFLPNRIRPVIDGGLVLSCTAVLLLPKLAGTCMMSSMRCNTLMKPFSIALAVIGIALYGICLIGDLRKQKEKC